MTDKRIRKTVVVNKPLTQVWQMWTTSEGLRAFFGVDNRIEMVSGGAFEIYFLMENDYGLRGSEGCKVISLLPQKMLSFSWNAPPKFEKIRSSEYKTIVVVEFEEQSEKETIVTLTHLLWPDGKQWDEVYDYFDKAWDIVLGRLIDVE